MTNFKEAVQRHKNIEEDIRILKLIENNLQHICVNYNVNIQRINMIIVAERHKLEKELNSLEEKTLDE